MTTTPTNNPTTATPNTIDNATFMIKLQALLDNHTPHYEGEKILVNDYIAEWLDTKRVLDLTPSAYHGYESKYRLYIKPFFEGKTLTEITYTDIVGLMKHLIQKGRSRVFVRDVIGCIIKPVFKEAYEVRQLIPSNPCHGVKIKTDERVSKTLTITDEEAKDLYRVARYESNVGNHYWVAIPLLACTGMRRGELLGLTWKDVQYKEQTGEWYLFVHQTVVEVNGTPVLQNRTKTADGTRMIAIPALLGEMLMEYKEQTQQNEKTFIISQKKNDKYEAPHNFGRSFNHWKRLAGITRAVTPHSFRRNYATTLFLEHVPLDIVKRQGGWKDDRMPAYYADKAMTEPLKTECAKAVGRHWEGAFTTTNNSNDTNE